MSGLLRFLPKSAPSTADIRCKDGRWSFTALDASGSPVPRPRRRTAKKREVVLTQEIGEGDYIVVANKLERGKNYIWTFDLKDISGKSIDNSRLETMSHLQKALDSSKDDISPPTTSMINSYLSDSVNKVAVFSKGKIGSQGSKGWRITTYGKGELLQFEPGRRIRGVQEKRPPRHVIDALHSTGPAEEEIRELQSWNIETSLGVTDANARAWVYKILPTDQRAESICQGAKALKSELDTRASADGIEGRFNSGGPPESYCAVFGSKAGEGLGKAFVTTQGWRFEADRTVEGQEGTWTVGRGDVNGEFCPSVHLV